MVALDSRLLLIIGLCSDTSFSSITGSRSFSIDYANKTFIKDGKPFRYISGSIHYSRVPYQYWKDRLNKMHAAGLDAIQTYVTWNTHQPDPNTVDFSLQNNLMDFIQIAQEVGLLCILRVGPYICAEWEMGGLPAWLLAGNIPVKLRTMDPLYINPVNKWLDILLPKLKPLLYSNGGPIIMIQIENEYGSYPACDKEYMHHLRDTFRHYLGSDVILFTTDGAGDGFLKCGATDGVFSTVDFGPGNATAGFAPMVKHNNNTGPLVNSEYYTGWLDHWGEKHAHTSTEKAVQTLDDILAMGANVNMYMFEGGTNFGYWNGATPDGPRGYVPVPTSYDYDAPLSEAGDTTYKYTAIRNTIAKHKKLPPDPVPSNSTKAKYGEVELQFVSTMISSLSYLDLKGAVHSKYPLNMERVNQYYGYVLYRHKVHTHVEDGLLSTWGVRDRAYVLVNEKVQTIFHGTGRQNATVTLHPGDYLDLLVENQGRLNYGPNINNNTKGLIANVTLNGNILAGWDMYSLNFSAVNNDLLNTLRYRSNARRTLRGGSTVNPSIFYGAFSLPVGTSLPQDTFLDMSSWGKGQAFVNGFNLGRYWPGKGPQVTLYLPGCYLKGYPAKNVLMLFELEKALCSVDVGVSDDTLNTVDSNIYEGIQWCFVKLVNAPILNGTVTNGN